VRTAGPQRQFVDATTLCSSIQQGESQLSACSAAARRPAHLCTLIQIYTVRASSRVPSRLAWQPHIYKPSIQDQTLSLQVPAIRALVALGCSVSVMDSVLSTPIHVAAGEGHNEAVLALQELVRKHKGVDVLLCPARLEARQINSRSPTGANCLPRLCPVISSCLQ